MNKYLLLPLLLLTACFAQAESVPQQTVDAIQSRIKSGLPDVKSVKVDMTPMAGIYRVDLGSDPILYSNADGTYMIAGELYDVTSGDFVNAAERDKMAVRSEAIKVLKVEDMIVFPAEGATKAIIHVFTDVDCGYCRKLHREVPELTSKGVEVRYLAFPRAGLESDSYTRMVSAWCADDRQQALTDLKNGKKIAAKTCKNNPVADQFKLGDVFGVRGTPSLILMDGTLIPGYRPAADLLEILGIR